MNTSWTLGEEEKSEIVNLHGITGWTVRELCVKYGVQPTTIYEVLRRRGVVFTAPGPGRKRYTQGHKDRAIAMYRRGESPEQIASQVHVVLSTVKNWLTRAGESLPPTTNRQEARRRHFKRAAETRGVSPESLLRVFREQRGKCRICGQRIRWGNGVSASACVDHCPKTAEIRGLLCNFCNLGLGNFKDSLSLLMNAASYISRFTRKGSPCESAK